MVTFVLPYPHFLFFQQTVVDPLIEQTDLFFGELNAVFGHKERVVGFFSYPPHHARNLRFEVVVIVPLVVAVAALGVARGALSGYQWLYVALKSSGGIGVNRLWLNVLPRGGTGAGNCTKQDGRND